MVIVIRCHCIKPFRLLISKLLHFPAIHCFTTMKACNSNVAGSIPVTDLFACDIVTLGETLQLQVC
jgi:hypothetical protein